MNSRQRRTAKRKPKKVEFRAKNKELLKQKVRK